MVGGSLSCQSWWPSCGCCGRPRPCWRRSRRRRARTRSRPQAIADALLAGLGERSPAGHDGPLVGPPAARSSLGRLVAVAFGARRAWVWHALGRSSRRSTSSPASPRSGATSCPAGGQPRERLTPLASAIVLLGLVLGILLGRRRAGRSGGPSAGCCGAAPTFLLATGGPAGGAAAHGLVDPVLQRPLGRRSWPPATGLPGAAGDGGGRPGQRPGRGGPGLPRVRPVVPPPADQAAGLVRRPAAASPRWPSPPAPCPSPRRSASSGGG